jgi:hypothetical protein
MKEFLYIIEVFKWVAKAWKKYTDEIADFAGLKSKKEAENKAIVDAYVNSLSADDLLSENIKRGNEKMSDSTGNAGNKPKLQ